MIKPKIYNYGYDINEIEKQIYTPQFYQTSWGRFCRIVENEHYGLSRVFISKDLTFPLQPHDFSGKELLIYVESGRASVKSNSLSPHETLLFMADQIQESVQIKGEEDTVLYIFSGPPTSDDLRDGFLKKSRTFNFRDQYWADVLWTMVNRAFAGKKIFLKRGNNSSFHFHCQKKETYFIHSGKLLLRLRAGKGEDRYFEINPGQAVDIPPGLIHQAGGLQDTVVIEISTRDYDTDAFLVESEFTRMPKLKAANNSEKGGLKLFLNTNDLEEAERTLQKEILSGISTDFFNVQKIVGLCKKYNQMIPISIAISETEPEKIIEQATEIAEAADYGNLVVKIPVGFNQVGVIKELNKKNIQVECSSGMNEAQAILAANAGARYFSLRASRIKDLGGDPSLIIKNIRRLLRDFDTEIIVDDIRSSNIRDVVDAFLEGANAVCAPLSILEKMSSHPKSTENVIRFVNAFHQWGKK